MALGQYDSLVEYCGPHTASSVFLILVCKRLLLFKITGADSAKGSLGPGARTTLLMNPNYPDNKWRLADNIRARGNLPFSYVKRFTVSEIIFAYFSATTPCTPISKTLYNYISNLLIWLQNPGRTPLKFKM